MAVSVLDIFKIGIGPSSSHTVGPMRAAHMFAQALSDLGPAAGGVTRVKAELFGSLGATGHGHGSEAAVLLGLEGSDPETVDTDALPLRAAAICRTGRLVLGTTPATEIGFDADADLVLHRNRTLTGHANAMVFTAWAGQQRVLRRTYYSIGGGFVLAGTLESAPGASDSVDRVDTAAGGSTPSTVDSAVPPDTDANAPATARTMDVRGDTTRSSERTPDEAPDTLSHGAPTLVPDPTSVPYPVRTGADLLELCHDHRLTIPELVMANERAMERADRQALLHIWEVMDACIAKGCATSGVLPGGLKVRRRANRLHKDLEARDARLGSARDPLAAMDWLTLWALAVNEENAAGGRVVTAPTNGAAGIIPAVLKYVRTHVRPDDADDATVDFLLVAGVIGTIYQQTASISGAEVGCQGEVGVACSMAAGALCHVLGGTPQQVANAAEIGLEHHLGLTCDPVGGLVQIPCIERNAVGAVKAMTAARLALGGDGAQVVSLDQVITTMMQTGADMKVKYKETARGGLALNIVQC